MSDYWPGSVIPARTASADEADVTSRGIMSPMDVTDAKDAYLGRTLVAGVRPGRRRQARAISLPLLAGLLQGLDAAALLLTSWIIGFLSAARLDEPLRSQTHVLAALLAGVATFYGLYRAGAYSAGRLRLLAQQMPAVVWGLLVGAAGLSACLLLLRDIAGLQEIVVDWVLSCAVILAGLRFTFHAVLRRWSEAGMLAQRIAVIGDPAVSARLLARLGEAENYRVIGLFNDRPSPAGNAAFQKSYSDLIEISKQTPVDGIVVALPLSESERIAQVRTALASIVADIYLVSDALWLPQRVSSASESLLIAIERPLKDWRALQKLLLDQVLAMVALLTLLPLLMVVALLIKLDSPGPVFFRQPRVGFNNQIFRIYKFRTMYHHMADLLADCQTTRGDARITRLGKWLRRFSIDELPQLLNVLQGDMSLVGPRPHAPNTKAAGKLFEAVVPGYAARHRVKPGITGWAQVNGWRGETQTTEQIRKRVELDLEYIQNWSLGLDVKILILTILREFVSPNAF